jgi:acetolactate synthase-1/2/3 large subunit
MPGGESVEVLDGLRRRGIWFVLVHNEPSAVFMADATARLTGKPGVCLTTLGPGAANAVVGVAHAYLDRSPVLLLTAQIPDRLHPRHTHQWVDLQALFKPITKHSFKLAPASADETVCAALALATSGRPGPVHIQVTNQDAAQPALPGPAPLEKPLGAGAAVSPISMAREVLARSRRPIIVAGLGLEPEKPYTALRKLAEAAAAPVITTPKGKGSLPDDHPLAAGTIGLTRGDPAYQLLDEADCVLALGFDVVELVKPWDQPAPLIWVAPWANDDPPLNAQVELVGPMQPVLEHLAVSSYAAAPDWGTARVAAHRELLNRQVLPTLARGRMLPQAVVRAVRASVPPDSVLATDVGSHKILSGLAWPAYAPNSFLVSNGLSSMGFALPAAMAASLARPGRPTVCFTGDAGLAMVIGELGLLARLQTPVIVVVFNDGALDLIRSQQVRAGKHVYGTEFVNPDFTQIAAAYQIDACRVSSEEECAEAVRAAVAAARPALIEALIDPVSYPTAPPPAARPGQ